MEKSPAMRTWAVVAFALVARTLDAQSASTPLALWQHSAFTGEAGPPAASGSSMQQSSDGYLWLAAASALVRYDGVRFTRIDSTNTPAFKSTGPGLFIPVLLDRTGAMWIIGPKGLLLSYRDGKFRVELSSGASGISSICEDSAGRMWVVTDRLRIFKNGKFETPPLPPGVPDSDIYGVEPDNRGGLWIGTMSAGLWHVSGATASHYSSGRIRALLQTADGSVYTMGSAEAEHAGLWRLRDGNWTEIKSPGDSARVYGRVAVAGPDGSAWISTNRAGLLRINSGKVEQFSPTQGLTSWEATSVFVSADGTVWVATDVGIDRLRAAPFVAFDDRNGIPFESMWSFGIDSTGALWTTRAGSRGQVTRFDGGPIRGTIGAITSNAHTIPALGTFTLLTISRTGALWLRPFAGGLVRYGNGRPTRIGRESGLPDKQVSFGVEAKDGTLWLRLTDGEFGRLRDGRYRAIPIPDGVVGRAFTADGLDRMWVASSNRPALVAIAGDSIVIKLALPGPDGDLISDLALEARDTLWVAGHRSLYRIADGGITAVRVPALNEILSPGAMLVVSNGQLWIAGQAGIVRVPLAELHGVIARPSSAVTPIIYSALDGIPIPRASGTVVTPLQLGPDGRVWVATANSLVVTTNASATANAPIPQVHIEDVSLGRERIDLVDGGSLKPNPQRLAIQFSAPSLSMPERMRVEYRLEGADETWIESKPPRVATYNQLQPGHYRFRVRAWNENGVASAHEAVLRFTVLAAWYQSWWFFAVIIIGIAAFSAKVASVLHRRRGHREATAAQARFEAVLEERTRLARELHDTLLQGFTGITLRLDGVRDSLQASASPLADELDTLLVRADRTLREAREMVWDMRQPALNETALIEALRETNSTIPNPGNVNVHHEVHGTPRSLSPTVVTTILRIGKESVVNALKHAKPTSIVVRIAFEPRRVLLEITDDGCGADTNAIENASSRGHWGVAGMRERARHVGGTLVLETTHGKGTTVRAVIPAVPQQ